MSPDPYLQVESQITSELPEFEFRGRDDDLDSARARQREDVVRYISCLQSGPVLGNRGH